MLKKSSGAWLSGIASTLRLLPCGRGAAQLRIPDQPGDTVVHGVVSKPIDHHRVTERMPPLRLSDSWAVALLASGEDLLG
jgi:hypothetical protein